MYFVLSAEDEESHVAPYLHAICETIDEARAEVERVVRKLGLKDGNGELLKVGTNDCDKWADYRYDEDGLLAWQSDGTVNYCVEAKWYGMTQKDML